jgi:hypothetical protein
LDRTAEAVELPEFFENMIVRYDCSASVKTLGGSVVFSMTARYVDTVIEVNENASIELAFAVTSMNGELPLEVSGFFFPFPLEAKNTTIEVPVAQSTQLYWSIFLDDALLSSYKIRGLFLGEENFDTSFGTVGTYHVRRVATYNNYDVFYDKATGWVVHLEETYGGGEQISSYLVTYSADIAETNATLSPPLPSESPYVYLLILGILLAVAGGASVFYFRRKKTSQRNQPLLT